MIQVHDDEIDFFDLFQTLWNGKWIISAFVAISVLLGSSFLFLKEAVYESKLVYSVNTIPPFYDADKVSTDFKNKFYSVTVFEGWKQNNVNTSLVFEDFSRTEMVDGFLLSKDEDDQLVTLAYKNEGTSSVLVKSNQLPIIDNFFKYAIHINELLKEEYIIRAKDELKIINTRLNNMGSAYTNVLNSMLSIDRYIAAAEKGENVLDIQYPTIPKKISPRTYSILLMSLVLGGIVGVFYILVYNAIKKRKEQLDKA